MVLKVPNANFPALHKRLVVDTVNGKVRVRKWPEKRGKNVPEQVRIQNERFAAAQRLAKTAKASIMNRFIDATKGTGLYPRDLFTKMMLAPPIELELDDGRVIRYGRATLETVVFQGVRLELTSTTGIPGTTLFSIPWPMPVIDTSNFYDITEPTVITIPKGVAVVEMTAGLNLSSNTGGNSAIFLSRVSAPSEFKAIVEWGGVRRATLSTGPLIVSEGEKFAVQPFLSNGRTAQPVTTFFTLNVLGAEV